MGCANGTLSRQVEHLDQRLPLSRVDIIDIQTLWEHVKRRFEETARENLLCFFRYHPYFQVLFPTLASLKNEQDMVRSGAFEVQAVAIFNVYDYVIDNLDRDIDVVMHKLEETATFHSKIENFYGEFFQYLEEPLVQALREKHFENFKEREEDLMRILFRWMQKHMTRYVDSSQHQGRPASCNH